MLLHVTQLLKIGPQKPGLLALSAFKGFKLPAGVDVNGIATSLLDMQRSDGSFGDEEEDDGSILSTGYALEALANLIELDKVESRQQLNFRGFPQLILKCACRKNCRHQ